MGLLADPQKGVDAGLHGSVDLAKLAYHAASDLAALALMSAGSPVLLALRPITDSAPLLRSLASVMASLAMAIYMLRQKTFINGIRHSTPKNF